MRNRSSTATSSSVLTAAAPHAMSRVRVLLMLLLSARWPPTVRCPAVAQALPGRNWLDSVPLAAPCSRQRKPDRTCRTRSGQQVGSSPPSPKAIERLRRGLIHVLEHGTPGQRKAIIEANIAEIKIDGTCLRTRLHDPNRQRRRADRNLGRPLPTQLSFAQWCELWASGLGEVDQVGDVVGRV